MAGTDLQPLRRRAFPNLGSGFTLTELLCALAISLGLLAATLSFWSQGREALRLREQRAQLMDQARAALAFIEADLQMAGFYGLTRSGGDFRFISAGDTASALPTAQLSQYAGAIAELGAAAHACGANYAIDLAVPVQASDGIFALGSGATASCAARGGGSVAGADTLTLRRANTGSSPVSAGDIQLLVDRIDPQQRFLLADGVLPTGITVQSGLLELHDLLTRIYYIARDSDGQSGLPALRVKTLSSVAGQSTFIDTELMPGIEDLQVELLLGGGWVGARRPAAADPVRAVRVTLIARAQDAVSATPQRATWSRTVWLRNAN
ncbi:MAG: prepilin-type N-terminal cleavage/methylation domain-containing protein [Steroidobacteraceae bacterium]